MEWWPSSYGENVKNDYMFFEGYASLGGERMGSKPKKGKPITETQKGSTLWSAKNKIFYISHCSR